MLMQRLILRVILSVAVLSVMTCKTAQSTNKLQAIDPSGDDGANADDLPAIIPAETFTDAVADVGSNLDGPAQAKAVRRLSKYLAFLGVDLNANPGAATLTRVLSSSTQFLMCDSFEDWVCLEKMPLIKPKTRARVETSNALGTPIVETQPLELELFFTKRWAPNADTNQPTLAEKLANIITSDAKNGLWMALYGMDDVTGSLKPVYDAIIAKKEAGVPIKAVFDTDTTDRPITRTTYPLTWALKKSTAPNWILGPVAGTERFNLGFKYRPTATLVTLLNKGISNEDKVVARLEWPDSGIMHNKFMVFQNGNNYEVWTGTTNVSKTCMGLEKNSNAGLLIKNKSIAQSFLKEFNQMYDFNDVNADPEKFEIPGGGSMKLGKFHGSKRPVANRYFVFPDKTELRVHFAPSDDGEHRAILPMLLSARKGDTIRVAMFGGGGIEYVRAFQYAASKGAKIQVILDGLTGKVPGSWIKDASAKLTDDNPYGTQGGGSIEVKLNAWCGLNHLKAATLTRKTGNLEIAESFIVGSQNWSKTGNDTNDENMITIRNRETGLDAARQFNEHYDSLLWPNTIGIDQSRSCSGADDEEEETAG